VDRADRGLRRARRPRRAARRRLVVADTGNHRVVVDPIEATAIPLDVGRQGAVDIATPVVAETLVVAGAPVRVRAEADPPKLLRGGRAWTANALPVTLSLALARSPGASGRVSVELLAATCDLVACRLRRTQRPYDLILT